MYIHCTLIVFICLKMWTVVFFCFFCIVMTKTHHKKLCKLPLSYQHGSFKRIPSGLFLLKPLILFNFFLFLSMSRKAATVIVLKIYVLSLNTMCMLVHTIITFHVHQDLVLRLRLWWDFGAPCCIHLPFNEGNARTFVTPVKKGHFVTTIHELQPANLEKHISTSGREKKEKD